MTLLTLTAYLFAFLDAWYAVAKEPGLACVDVWCRLQKEHQRDLLAWVAREAAIFNDDVNDSSRSFGPVKFISPAQSSRTHAASYPATR